MSLIPNKFSERQRQCDVPGVVNKKKLHDGESFANRWSHRKRRLFAGGLFVLEKYVRCVAVKYGNGLD